MRLEKRLQLLDQKRRSLLAEVAALKPQQRTARPLAGKWSILEIVEHLVIAEKEILAGLPEPSRLTGRQRRLSHCVAYPLVMLILKFRVPVKVPSPTMIPRGQHSLEQLQSLWDETMEWLKKYVEGLDEKGRQQAVFEHPVAGPLTIGQALHMDQLHLESHVRQIRKRLELLGAS